MYLSKSYSFAMRLKILLRIIFFAIRAVLSHYTQFNYLFHLDRTYLPQLLVTLKTEKAQFGDQNRTKIKELENQKHLEKQWWKASLIFGSKLS